MSYIERKSTVSGETVKLYYEDYGQGQPVVLIHGWPLSGDMWEYQVPAIVNAGFRCITYDRRGFGKSSRPWSGYDYDSLGEDLKAVLEGLNLQNVVLIGFSMGGGEIARYFGKYGSDRVTKAAFISAVTPYMSKTADNPDGVDPKVFEQMTEQMKTDRQAFLAGFTKQFYGVTALSHPVSSEKLDYDFIVAGLASPRATLVCAASFASTDFRKDLQKIKVPTLVIHGDADKTVPIDSSDNLTAKAIAGSQYIVYEGAPHGLFITEKNKLNEDLLRFLKK